jgi:KDO2-lipid IV(A) lauroyltransferase
MTATDGAGRPRESLRLRLQYRLEALALLPVYRLVRLLPIGLTSRIGAVALGLVGPWLPAHKTARRNLEMAFPEKPAAEIDRILAGMWRNLGHTAGEFPKLDTMVRRFDEHVELVGHEVAERVWGDGRPVVFFSAHLANWELNGIAGARLGVKGVMVYRAPNNPLLRDLFEARARHPDLELVPKGPEAGKRLFRRLREGKSVGMLIDQKLNEGIAVPFFGRDAMTAPAFAQLALRFGCPVVPVRPERLGTGRLRITFHEPLEVTRTDDLDADVNAVVTAANATLETWIRERPEEWFWVHRRWKA